MSTDPPPPISLPDNWEDIDWVDPKGNQCSVGYENDWAESCELGFECNNQWMYSWCWNDGDTWYCDCEGQNGYSQVMVPDAAVIDGDACRLAGAVCATDLPDDLEETTCWDSYSSFQRDYCETQRQCGSEIKLGEASVVESTSWQYSSCYWGDSEEGLARCYCQGNTGGLSVAVPNQGDETCNLVMNVCEQGVDDTSQGELSCEIYYEGTRRDQCDINYQCLQEASSAGVPISLSGEAGAYCYLTGDTEWECYCSNDGEYFEQVGDDGRAVCQQAGAHCVGKLEDLTQAGGGFFGFDMPNGR